MPASFKDDFLLYWSSLASVITATGRMEHGRSWDPTKLDLFTQGLDRHCRRNLRHLPGATDPAPPVRQARRRSSTVGTTSCSPRRSPARPPSSGWLDPAQGFDTVMSRLLEWVAFTPLQNATGAPAISLPLATTAAGLPQGMMLAAGHGGEAMLLELAYELEEARPWPLLRDA